MVPQEYRPGKAERKIRSSWFDKPQSTQKSARAPKRKLPLTQLEKLTLRILEHTKRLAPGRQAPRNLCHSFTIRGNFSKIDVNDGARLTTETEDRARTNYGTFNVTAINGSEYHIDFLLGQGFAEANGSGRGVYVKPLKFTAPRQKERKKIVGESYQPQVHGKRIKEEEIRKVINRLRKSGRGWEETLD